MPSLLIQLPRLLRRAALFSLASMAWLVMAGAAGTTEPREGSTEESVHAAAEYANALNKWLTYGADDSGADVALPARDAFSLAPADWQAPGFRPQAFAAPSVPDGAPGAARAPPVLG
jgi:hypothetical protein